jgi:integrase/recombinase XerC
VWQEALAQAEPRTRLMLRLAAEAGLRRGEIAQIRDTDIVDGIGGPQLLVHGKGGKARVIPISPDLGKRITEKPGWLFSDGLGGHIGARRVGVLCSEALPGEWTLHTLRHRFATRAYRGTRNLRAVQIILGHASVATTERYTAVDDGECRATMEAARYDERRVEAINRLDPFG